MFVGIMPQALDVDYSQAKLIYASTGSYKIAAEQTGIPYDAIRQRGCREQWPTQVEKAAELVSHRVTEALGMARLSMEERNKRVREGHAIAAEKVANKLTKMDEDELFLSGQLLQQHAKHAATVFGWESGSTNVNVNVGVIGDHVQDCPTIDV